MFLLSLGSAAPLQLAPRPISRQPRKLLVPTGCDHPGATLARRQWRTRASSRDKSSSMGVSEMEEMEEVEEIEEMEEMEEMEEIEEIEGDDRMEEGVEADVSPEIIKGQSLLGDRILDLVLQVLTNPDLEDVQLYSYKVNPQSKAVDIRLDKLSDLYGSPSIDDIEKFTRLLITSLETDLGPEKAGEFSLEVSSPGAERQLRVPDDLLRFCELPMRVESRDDKGNLITQVLSLVEYVEGGTRTQWKLADVRANVPGKGRPLTKKQKEQMFDLPLDQLVRVRLHIDF